MIATTSSGCMTLDIVKVLGSDPVLRSRLLDNPAATLRDLGVEIPAGGFPEAVVLPSATEIAALGTKGEASDIGSVNPTEYWAGFIL